MRFVVRDAQGLEVLSTDSADEAVDAALVCGEGATLTGIDGPVEVDYFVEGGRLVDAAGSPVDTESELTV